MKLKIIFEETDDLEGKKNFQTTFTGIQEETSDENLKSFANAYASLVNADSYDIYKVIETELI